MGYTVKWVEDHLGITRKALRNYEAKGLMPKDGSRNLYNYRDYEEADIDRIWSIKLLQGIGFSVAEIKNLIENPDVDFYESIIEKIDELDERRKEIESYISFAKAIKLTGRIPSAKAGSVKYADFIRYARDNWHFNLENAVDTSFQEKEEENAEKPTEEALVNGLMPLLDEMKHNQYLWTTNAYFTALAALSRTDYRSNPVQILVSLLFDCMKKQNEEIGAQIDKAFFVRYTVPLFEEKSDIGLMFRRNYGEHACQFIARAVAYFGDNRPLDNYNHQGG